MLQPGRKYSVGTGYRYGFNGKEMDNEVKGIGAQYDYGFRIYDSRIGRFLSVDPLFQSYPWYTPYQFAGNMPIWAIDLDGLEEKKATIIYTVRIFDIKGNLIKEPTNIEFGRTGCTILITPTSKVAQQGDEGVGVIESFTDNHQVEGIKFWRTVDNWKTIHKSFSPEPDTKNNTVLKNDPPTPGSEKISWIYGTETTYEDITMQQPKIYSIDIPFESQKADFDNDANANKSINDFANNLKKDGISEINYDLEIAANSPQAPNPYYGTTGKLAEARSLKINSLLAAKGIKGNAHPAYRGGNSPKITAETTTPVMNTVRIGYKETVYRIKEKLVNGKPTGSSQRTNQVGPQSSRITNEPTPQNKKTWNH